ITRQNVLWAEVPLAGLLKTKVRVCYRGELCCSIADVSRMAWLTGAASLTASPRRPRRIQTTTKSGIKKMKTDSSFVHQNYPVRYKTIRLNELDIFYREAGPQNAPTLLLLHGFPTSLTCSGILYRALPHHSMWLLPTILASVKAVCRVTRIS